MTTRNSPEAWDQRYAESEMVWSLEPNQFVVEYLSGLPTGKMLDLGGGEGRNALWFAGRGWHVENSDFSPVAVEKFLQRAEREGLLELCTGTTVDATQPESCVTKPVDLAVVAYLQIPAADLAAAISTAAKSLRPGGTLFGVWHARENLEQGFGGPPSPELNPTQDELRAACDALGLKVHTVTMRDRFFDSGGQERKAIDVILLATAAA
ncbi:bifunctional 2-polyprenyl-6-hydroxyphenol methylase/3-demethylubiquinol 3-O-methyltransferase UbiG [Aurantimicrobium sp. MWH-Uga1]|uniref:class I SAM-dependent methyltransferase n=1 Tax=Aurantimicrobium sp. MWH-Uga1 TaxID=2079575 RepID=UPI000DEDD666|nr:class I SAM-dependent methyltransferase [Aurantimicrobium sp. MWH-Uga1]AXE55177.1 tellurite resistance protein TehB [Aurantimicrobium sp. MWH-Uga1]